MGGRGQSSMGQQVSQQMQVEARDKIRDMGFDPDSAIPRGEYSTRVKTAHAQLSNWAYDGGDGDPGIGNLSAKSRESMIALEKEEFARTAKSFKSGGRWHEDKTRGISESEAKRRNGEEWERAKLSHERTMAYLERGANRQGGSKQARRKISAKSQEEAKGKQYYDSAVNAGFSAKEARKRADFAVKQWKQLRDHGAKKPGDRQVTSTTYENASKRQSKHFDEMFFRGRR